MGRSSGSCSSSCSSNIAETSNNNYHPPPCSSSFSSLHDDQYHYVYRTFKRDLSTDLRLGLSIDSASHDQQDTMINITNSTDPRDDWRAEHSMNENEPLPTEAALMVAEGSDEYCVNGNDSSLYVKVYMEGHPIGRKLDVLAHNGYQDLITTLDHMFNANILWGAEVDAENCEDFHVLTYEDEEGDWMMVGDVPWGMFLSAVKRLKITRACPC